ncbi:MULTISPECIES: hypothetical protein [Robiginitalea]|uniref:hypothetical protein n=1 Tax=Robiginitalea TaxID=252306 RepID=UPI002349F066|nr:MULTISPECIES: hypothetical protein [unclassified Robiginitalea]MDC6354002.1 hypothetical protein [Robiginitalea sp. PM2]MDC6374269.1 hypothetical protein [Robiginitalea sp. SP8]
MKHVVWAICTLALLAGCSDQTTIYQDNLQDDLVLETNPNALAAAISYSQAGVLGIYEENNASGKAPDEAGDYPLTLIASVSPPSYQAGDNLTASHVDLDGAFAYVAYNTVGETYSGAVDVVNISDPHNPRVTARLFYLNADINSLAYANGYLYIVGGVDAETSATATANSFVARIPASNGTLSTDAVTYGFQQGYNATDVLVLADRILVSSGKEGSITAYNPTDLTILDEAFVADARSVAATPTGIAVLDAGTGVRLWNTDLTENSVVAVTTDLGEATKKTLTVGDGTLLVAEADRGTGLYDLGSGELLEYLPIPIHPDGVEADAVVTNAVVSNEAVIFMANGGAGLCISEEDANGADLVGIVELDGSVNYVASQGDYAFAATGEGGLQIIKLNRPSESLESRCEGLDKYRGSSRMEIASGTSEAYSGQKRLNTIDVFGELLLCGSWTVNNDVEIAADASMSLYGTLAVGKFYRKRDITVGEGSVLVIEGDVTIYGDLILEDGASVEFLGTESVLDVFGQVVQKGNATVTGTFRDVRGVF